MGSEITILLIFLPFVFSNDEYYSSCSFSETHSSTQYKKCQSKTHENFKQLQHNRKNNSRNNKASKLNDYSNVRKGIKTPEMKV